MRWGQGNMARTVLVCALACLALAFAPTAAAQDSRKGPPPKEYNLHVAQQPLTQALESLYDQTGVYYGYSPNTDEEEQMLVGPLKGKFTIEEALTKLLQSTGLTYAWTNSKTMSIVRAPPPPPKAAPPQQVKVPRDSRAAVRWAAAKEEWDQDRILEEVLTERQRIKFLGETTGTILLLDREAIERSGVTSVWDLLKYIPQQPYLRPDGARSSAAQYAELRGLGADTTLVLINGQRAFASAASFAVNAFDLNTIPLSSVERVELLFDSTSVRHGMDAIGGVLNIVLRDTIRHPNVQMHYGSASGGGSQFQTSGSLGYVRDTVRAALMLDYTTTQTLLGEERALWADQDYRRFGSIDQRSINSSPGNVTALPGLGNLPGLNSPIAAIPESIAGERIALSEYLAGQRNFASLLRYFPIVPETRRASVVANAQVEVSPDFVASGEVMYVDRSVRYPTIPPLVPGLLVPLTNPYNTFHLPVVSNTMLQGMERQEQNIDSTLTRGTASLRGKLREWSLEFSLLRSEEDAELTSENLLDVARLMQVLANPDPAQTLDLFRPGPAASQVILDSLVAPPQVSTYATDATQLSGLASGRLFELPGGLVTAMIGGEWRKESVQFDSALDSSVREVGAGFAEVTVPLVGIDMHVPGIRELKVTAGGRLDDYSDFGHIFNPQFGLRWLPYQDLALHASFGRSFRAPSMYELYLPRAESPRIVPIADPRRGGAAATVALISGGNAELDPTRGESLTAGFVFTPQQLPSIELFATYWDVTMDDRITLLAPTLVLANESLFPERIIRDTPTALDVAAGQPGAVTHLDVSRMNFGRLSTSGFDLGVRYEIESSFGQFAANAIATVINDYDTVDVPATPEVDRINLANETGTITKWRGVGGLDWDRGALGATVHLRYIPAYYDTRGGVRNGRRISAQTFVDLQATVDLGKLGRALLRGVQLTAGASNLLNQEPHFAEVAGVQGYDTSQGDLKGRFWYVRLGKTF
jgi:iron complex outermembrane recepter protein